MDNDQRRLTSAATAGRNPAPRLPNRALTIFAGWFLALLVLLCEHTMQAANPPPPTYVDQDLDLDGKPDLIWWRTDCNGLLGSGSCGEVWFWGMQGYVHNVGTNEYINQTNPNNYAGQFFAGGDFGSLSNGVPVNIFDGRPEIIFRNDSADITVIGYQDYTPGATFLRAAGGVQILSFPGTNWTIVGATDMGSWVNGSASSVKDGKGDLTWQNKVTGQKAIWFMDGTNRLGILTFSVNSPLNATGWNLAAVGDFGASTNSGVKDGFMDFAMVNYSTGELGIQYTANSQGFVLGQAGLVLNPANNTLAFPFADRDRRIFNAGDFGGFITNGIGTTNVTIDATLPQDGRADLVTRHQTDGRTFFWIMDGVNFKAEIPMSPQRFDTVWRLCPQDINPSVWRVTNSAFGGPKLYLSFSTTSSPPSITVNLIDFPTPVPPDAYTVKRCLCCAGIGCTTLTTTLTGSSFTDTGAVAGVMYQYTVSGTSIGTSLPALSATAVLDVPPVHSRGKILLLVETNLSTQLGGSYTNFVQDLAGDGWAVIANTNAPRHEDPWLTQNNVVNYGSLKQWITNQYNLDPANTKGLIILGHVTVPYSGLLASDGHSGTNSPGQHHAGAWAADAFYADIDGVWVQNTLAVGISLNDGFDENRQDPGNNKFTNDFLPSPLELYVGRIDFARLPTFGIPDSPNFTLLPAETALYQRYLDKDHRYRFSINPSVAPTNVLYTGYLKGTRAVMKRDEAADNAVAIFGDWHTSLTVGEPFRNNLSFFTAPRPSIFSGTSGGGGPGEIYNKGDYGIALLLATTPMLQTNAEPQSIFWSIYGSFFADWNLQDDLPRAMLTTTNYNLAVFPHIGDLGPALNLRPMAFGDTLGAGFLSTVNTNADPSAKHRWLDIQGDPTLRLNPLKPPTITGSSLIGNVVTLNWKPSRGMSYTQYYVYRASSFNGPFGAPLTNTTSLTASFIDDPTQRVYLLRGESIVRTGSGSYKNLSQGVFRSVP